MRTVYLAVRFADGTGALFTLADLLRHDFTTRPVVESRLVGVGDESMEQRRRVA